MPLRWLLRSAYALARRWYAWRRPVRRTTAIAVRVGDRVLTVAHSYKDGVFLPGGGLRRDEVPAAGAARELREETGIVVDPADLRLVRVEAFDGRYGPRRTWHFEVHLTAVPPLVANGWETVAATFVDAAGVPGLAPPPD